MKQYIKSMRIKKINHKNKLCVGCNMCEKKL